MAAEQLAETLEKLEALVETVAEGEGYELVQLEYMRAQKSHIVRITIDRAGRTSYPTADSVRSGNADGVTIDDCVRLSRLLGPELDVADLITTAYNLEVSSPGLNRPLKKEQHFKLALGMDVRIKTRTPIDGESFFIAPLQALSDDGIILTVRGAETHIPFRLIKQANLEYDFGG